ncbi:MAG TPA: flagellar biosynthetic protein FliR [Ruminococcaceae bacterium]|nr:flagellar biosynthetic protein FliR [Oscillospiraceae bacterium]
MEVNGYKLDLLLMIFMRMSGCVMFNPILGRRNIPNIFKIGLSLILSLFTYQVVPASELHITSFLSFVLLSVRELFIGFIIGFVLQLFMSVIVMGGEMIDMQTGMAMAKIYDPTSNVSMPLSALLINAMFILIFFVSNAHITLIKIFISLCQSLPYGSLYINPDIFKNMTELFSLMLIYSAKLAMPMVAVQIIGEVGVGLIMRAVPQVDIFAMEIQIKIILGFIVIFILVPPLAAFIEDLIGAAFSNISSIISLLT